jgi:hypothetical protein
MERTMRKTHARIVSHTAERTRLRIFKFHRSPENMKRFVAAVKTLPCVDKVKTNTRTGSILIYHKGGTQDQFVGVFKDIGSILLSTLSIDLPEEGKAGLDLPQAVNDLDFRLGFINKPYSLKNLIPMSLGVLAFIQMRRQGVKITAAPWYVLAYLAYFTYTKLTEFEEVIDTR